MSLFFLVLSTGVFFSSAQAFIPFSPGHVSDTSSKVGDFSSILWAGYFSHQLNPTHVYAPVMEILYETEENEELRTEVVSIGNTHAGYGYHFTLSQHNHQYAHLPSLFFYKQVKVPYFILFHSWKNYVS